MSSSLRPSAADAPGAEPDPRERLRGRDRIGLAALCALVFLLRLPRLLDLPIFCDEAIYLRYARLVANDLWSNAFVSLVDPKPPLHFWLLAGALSLTEEPLRAGRLLSAAAGAATIPFAFLACLELAAIARMTGARARRAAWIAALFFAACPFLAFYQRLALAESLLVLESVTVGWLALRLAAERQARLSTAAFLGVACGLAFLTKQNTSYLLVGLVPLAAAAKGVSLATASGRRWLGRAAAAFAIALLLWSPVAFIDRGPGLRDRVFFRAEHAELGSVALHLRLAKNALRYVFVPGPLADVPSAVPPSAERRPAEGGWLWRYLTPPVELAGLAALVWLLFSGSRRVFLFLAGWTGLVLVPLAFSANLYPRYAITAVPPILLATALFVAGVFPDRKRSAAPALEWVPAAAALALLLWPLAALRAQIADWQRQDFVQLDRWQYVSGWPAGAATRQAIAELSRRAARGPILLITNHLAGVPADAVWVELEGAPGVSLFFVEWMDERSILQFPRSPEWALARTRFHHFQPGTMMVRLTDRVPVLFVTGDPVATNKGTFPAGPLVARHNPAAVEVARFSNPRTEDDPKPAEVVIYRLR